MNRGFLPARAQQVGMFARRFRLFAAKTSETAFGHRWSKSTYYAFVTQLPREKPSLSNFNLNDVDVIKMFLTTSQFLRESAMENLDMFLDQATPVREERFAIARELHKLILLRHAIAHALYFEPTAYESRLHLLGKTSPPLQNYLLEEFQALHKKTGAGGSKGES